MKDTIDTLMAWTVIGCVAAGGFVTGYVTAENKHLRGDIKIMSLMSELLVKTHDAINKNKEEVPEETEE